MDLINPQGQTVSVPDSEVINRLRQGWTGNIPVSVEGRRLNLNRDQALQVFNTYGDRAQLDTGTVAQDNNQAAQARHTAEVMGGAPAAFVVGAVDTMSGGGASRMASNLHPTNPGQNPVQSLYVNNPVASGAGQMTGFVAQGALFGAVGRAAGMGAAATIGAAEAESATLGAVARAAPRLFAAVGRAAPTAGDLAAQSGAAGVTSAEMEAAANNRPLTAESVLWHTGVNGLLFAGTHGVLHAAAGIARGASTGIRRAMGAIAERSGALEDLVMPQPEGVGTGFRANVLPSTPGSRAAGVIQRALGVTGDAEAAANPLTHAAVRAEGVAAGTGDRAIQEMAAGIETAGRNLHSVASNATGMEEAFNAVIDRAARAGDASAARRAAAVAADSGWTTMEALRTVTGQPKVIGEAMTAMQALEEAAIDSAPDRLFRATVEARSKVAAILDMPSVRASGTATGVLETTLRDLDGVLQGSHFGEAGRLYSEINAAREYARKATQDMLSVIGKGRVIEGQEARGLVSVPDSSRITTWLKRSAKDPRSEEVLNNYIRATSELADTMEMHGVGNPTAVRRGIAAFEGSIRQAIPRAEAIRAVQTASITGAGDVSRLAGMATKTVLSGAIGGPGAAAAALGVSAAQSFSANPARFWAALGRLESMMKSVNARYGQGLDAVGRMLRTGVPAEAGRFKYLIPQGVMTFRNLKEEREAFDTLAEQVNDFANNPETFMQAITTQTHTLAQMDPAVSDHYAVACANALAYLKSLIPDRPIDPFTNKPTPASRAVMRQTWTAVSVFMDPMSTAGLMAENRLTAGHVQALQAIYPAHYAKFKFDVAHMLTTARRTPFSTQAQISTLFQTPLTGTLQPNFIAIMQAQHRATQEMAQQAHGSRGNRTSSSLRGLVGTYTTESQSMEITNGR